MNKFCTDIGQSKKLIELGIDVNTADMCYPIPCEEGDKPLLEQGGFGSTPCWSLVALLKLLPLPTLEETMITTNTTKWKCTIYCESYAKYWSELHNDAIDAVFEMVVWLNENNKI